MSSHDKKQHFIDLLHELFQFDQPELDFGFYKIMHAKSGQIQRFINAELSRYIDEAFAGQVNQSAEDKLSQARHAILEAIGEDAFEGDELKDQYKNTNFGKAFLETRDEVRTGGALSDDAQVYDHLYRFFSRYYDQGDFLSTRYRQAPSDTRDAPYSVPYDGREVYLHWANKDQYYIKSSETLRDYRFDLNAAVHGLDGGDHKYILIEMGDYFDIVLKPRLQKVVFSKDWKDGKPQPDKDGNFNGVSHCFKYLRLESYEDALNNLVLHEDADRDAALEADDKLRHDYLLHYWLDTETRGSQSLLNIEHFRDPTNYRMRIKQPGSDESREQPVDLVETFNWLIGLHVELLDKPRTFAAEFEYKTDPDLPEDAATRLRVAGRLREREDGRFWFRMVEGWVARTPAATGDVDKVLVIWRKLTDDPEQNAAVLETLLTQHLRINQRDTEFDAIYINGPHGLSTDFEGKYRLHSLEEAFHAAMWAQD